MKTQNTFLVVLVLVLLSCAKKTQITGRWYNPVSKKGIEANKSVFLFVTKKEGEQLGEGSVAYTNEEGYFGFDAMRLKNKFGKVSVEPLDTNTYLIPSSEKIITSESSGKLEFIFIRKKRIPLIINLLQDYKNDYLQVEIEISNPWTENITLEMVHKYVGYSQFQSSFLEMVEGQNTAKFTVFKNGVLLFTITQSKTINGSLNSGQELGISI